MAYPPGVSGNLNGRPKGALGVKFNDVKAHLEAAGYNPIESLIRLAMDENAERKLRFYADRELLARVAPLLKTVEVKADEETKEQVDILKQQIAELREQHKKDH